MKRILNALVGLLAVVLLGSCRDVTLPQTKVQPNSPITDYVSEMLEPVMAMCAGAAAFWIKESKWPINIEELVASPVSGNEWQGTMSRFADVVFTPQSDGSVQIAGTMSPPATFAGKPVKASLVRFSAKITMHRAPETASGWKPMIETSIAEPKGASTENSQARRKEGLHD